MFRNKKNKSVLLTLHDRELNNACAPYFSSLNVISNLLRSDAPLFKTFWQKSSKRPITYDSGYLYFNDYTTCFTLFGKNRKPTFLFKFQKSKAQKKISDVISYSIPVYKTHDICNCSHTICSCLSQYLMSISKDNWLCQHSMTTGKLLREFYVNRVGSRFTFKYVDWDIYADRFVLTSTLNPDSLRDGRKSNIVVNFALFTASAFDFLMLLEIKRSVFGENCTAANISDRHLILGLGSLYVNVYNFDDFINQGDLVPYHLGQIYEGTGRVGYYPTGLPLNFSYTAAPPMLFKVQGFGQIIRFGGFPFHYITAASKNSKCFTVTSIETNIPAQDGCLETSEFNDCIDALVFHPDQSNRLLFKETDAIHCFSLTYGDGLSKLNKLFSMGFPELKVAQTTVSSFGRRIRRASFNSDISCSICCSDYASDLDLFAIMGTKTGNSDSPAFVKLFDSFTGEEVRTVQLRAKVDDCNIYQLYIDMGSIVLIERKDRFVYTVYVYNM